MNAIAVLLLIFFGVGILIYVKQAWQSGEVRMGSSGFKPYTPSKDREPLVFYFGILLYIGLGSFFLIYAVTIIFGHAELPPLA